MPLGNGYTDVSLNGHTVFARGCLPIRGKHCPVPPPNREAAEKRHLLRCTTASLERIYAFPTRLQASQAVLIKLSEPAILHDLRDSWF